MDESRDILDQVDALMGRRVGLVSPMKPALEDDFPLLTEVIGEEAPPDDEMALDIIEEVVVTAPPGLAEALGMAPPVEARRAPEAPPAAPKARDSAVAPGVSVAQAAFVEPARQASAPKAQVQGVPAQANPTQAEAPPWETRLHRLLGEHEARMETLFRRIVREELERRGGA